MATGSSINVGYKSGSVNFTVESLPPNPTVKLSSNQTWATTGSSKITVSEHTGTDDRNATITITATTTANSEYNGTASATSSYTLTQSAWPGRTITINGPSSLRFANKTDNDVYFYVYYGASGTTFRGGTEGGTTGNATKEVGSGRVETDNRSNFSVELNGITSAATTINIEIVIQTSPTGIQVGYTGDFLGNPRNTPYQLSSSISVPAGRDGYTYSFEGGEPYFEALSN